MKLYALIDRKVIKGEFVDLNSDDVVRVGHDLDQLSRTAYAYREINPFKLRGMDPVFVEVGPKRAKSLKTLLAHSGAEVSNLEFNTHHLLDVTKAVKNSPLVAESHARLLYATLTEDDFKTAPSLTAKMYALLLNGPDHIVYDICSTYLSRIDNRQASKLEAENSQFVKVVMSRGKFTPSLEALLLTRNIMTKVIVKRNGGWAHIPKELITIALSKNIDVDAILSCPATVVQCEVAFHVLSKAVSKTYNYKLRVDETSSFDVWGRKLMWSDFSKSVRTSRQLHRRLQAINVLVPEIDTRSGLRKALTSFIDWWSK